MENSQAGAENSNGSNETAERHGQNQAIQQQAEDLEGVVGRVSLKGQFKRSRPETSESSSQESSSDQDDAHVPSTSRRASYRQFKLPNSPPRTGYRSYNWANVKAGQGRSREGHDPEKRDQSPSGGREPSPVSEYVNYRARIKTRSEEAGKSLTKAGECFEADCESDDCACPSSASSKDLKDDFDDISPEEAKPPPAMTDKSGFVKPPTSYIQPSRSYNQASSISCDVDLSGNKPFTPPLRPGLPSVRPNAMKNRQKQLETLKKYEEKLRNKLSKPNTHKSPRERDPPLASSVRKAAQNPMFVHVLDISKAILDLTVTWFPIGDTPGYEAPEETIFYSLVEGRAELIVVGGIQTDLNSMQRGWNVSTQVVVSNMAHFIQAKRYLR